MSSATVEPITTPYTANDSGSAGAERALWLLEEGVGAGELPGGVLMASVGGRLVTQVARGTKLPARAASVVSGETIEVDTVFDLGGLSETICTATLMMRLVSAGKVGVLDRASRFLQALGIGQRSGITLAHLLSHSAGFPAGVTVYDELVKANAGPRPGILASSGAKQYAYNHFHNLALRFEAGTRQLHSDANYIVLGEICEIVTGLPLEKAFSRFVAAPLQLRSLNFIDLATLRRRNVRPVVELFAPSGECPRRERVLAGEVWDENAWVMGGVAGHAGLFGTARDVHAWALEMLRALRGESQLCTQETARTFMYPELPQLKAGLKLGFDAFIKDAGSEQQGASTAVTTINAGGCSVVLDPALDMATVFLSNAPFSAHHNKRFPALRAEIHAALLETV